MRRLLIESQDELKEVHRKWIEKELKNHSRFTKASGPKGIAVGDKSFVEQLKARL